MSVPFGSSKADLDEERVAIAQGVSNLLLEKNEILGVHRLEQCTTARCEDGCGGIEDLLGKTGDQKHVLVDSPFPAHRPPGPLNELQLDLSVAAVGVCQFEAADIEGCGQHGHGAPEEHRPELKVDPHRLSRRLLDLDLVAGYGTLLELVLDRSPRSRMHEVYEWLPEYVFGRLARELSTGRVDIEDLVGVEDEQGRRSAFDQRVEPLVGWSQSLVHLASIIESAPSWRYSLFHSPCSGGSNRYVCWRLTRCGMARVDVARLRAARSRRHIAVESSNRRNLGLVLALLAAVSPAQEINDEIELTRAIIQTQRQAIVTAAMQLSGEESEAFWPLYREYREAMRKVDDRSVKLITDYSESFDTMSDEIAQEMLKEFLGIRQGELDVTRKYLKRFQKILPATKVARFFQLENKLDAVIDFELAAEVPLVP